MEKMFEEKSQKEKSAFKQNKELTNKLKEIGPPVVEHIINYINERISEWNKKKPFSLLMKMIIVDLLYFI